LGIKRRYVEWHDRTSAETFKLSAMIVIVSNTFIDEGPDHMPVLLAEQDYEG
jgi:hypothetical protein